MKHFIHHIKLALLFTFISGPCALTPAQTIFKGQVLNGTQDSSAVSGLTVDLQGFGPHDSVPRNVASQQTNQNGFFTFRLSDVDSTLSYYNSVNYQGVRYFGQPSQIKEPNQTIESTIVVFDSTHSTDAVTNLMHHIFFQDMGDVLSIRESRVMANDGLRAIVSTLEDTTRTPSTLSYGLPARARRFQAGSRQLASQLVVSDGRILDQGIMLPGNRQISYTYEIPWQGDRTNLNFPIEYPTRSLEIFSASPNITLSSETIRDMGPFSIRDVAYQRYHVESPQAGTQLSLSLSRQGFAAESPIPAILITSLLLIVGLLLVKTQRVQTPSEQSTKHLRQRREQLIRQLKKSDREKHPEWYQELQTIDLQLIQLESKKQ
jgi:hypothetical protein